MNTKKVLLMALIAAWVLTYFDSGASAWQARIRGTGTDLALNDANAVRVDSAGNVIAAGSLTNADRSQQFTVIKFSGANGTELWRQSLVGEARAIAIDAAGDVVAAGHTGAFTVIKFSGVDGTELWRQVVSNDNLPGLANAVTVDGAGDVVAAGSIVDRFLGGGYTVIKFSGADGTQLWRQFVHGIADTAGSDAAFAVAVNAAGNGASAGVVDTARTNTSKFTVVKVEVPEPWVQFITGSDGTANTDNAARAVTVDGAGDVIAAGSIRNIDTGPDFTVIKFSGVDGTELWRQVVNGSANDFDAAQAVTVDAAGVVIAAGFIRNIGTRADFTVISFLGGDGTELWRQVIDGTAHGNDFANAVTVDGSGDVIAAGSIRNIDTGAHFTVIKFDRASGTELWRQLIDGNVNADDNAAAITVDGAGDVIAAGSTLNSAFVLSYDFTVVKLKGADGSDF